MSDLSRAEEKRAERRKLAEQMRSIIDEPAGDDGLLSSEQEAEFDRLHERQEELGTQIAELEAKAEEHQQRSDRLAELEAGLKKGRGTRAGRQDTADLDNDAEELEEERRRQEEADQGGDEAYSQAYESYLRHGPAFMLPEERQALMGGMRRGGADKAFTPESRAQSVAQDTKGGFLVPQGMMQSVTRALKQFGGLRRTRAQVLTTSDGREIPWPTYDDTSNKGRLIQENKGRSTTDVTLGQTVLYAYGYSSDFIKIPFELLQDSEVDIVGMIGGIAGERIGRITAEHFTTGDGASKPHGITTQAVVGVTAASATDIEWDEMIDLKHSVDPAYRDSPQWMFNDTTLKEIKKLKDGNGDPLWQSGVANGEPNTIDGDPYVVNQEMANTVSGAVAVVYGDFSLYKIRDVSGMQLRRLDERFADNGQVGFIMFSRHDGALVDAGQGPVKTLKMA